MNNYDKGQIGVLVNAHRSAEGTYRVKIVLNAGQQGKSMWPSNCRYVPEDHFKVIQYSTIDAADHAELVKTFNLHKPRHTNNIKSMKPVGALLPLACHQNTSNGNKSRAQ